MKKAISSLAKPTFVPGLPGLLFALLVALPGCGSTSMTQTGPAQTPHAANCDVQVFTTAPASGYAEIGVVDVTPGSFCAKCNAYDDLGEFREKIQPYVCQAGGDAAIAYANGLGNYIKATILKRTDASAQASPPASSPSDQAANDGCRYDTQCKGDRICVSGACVAPSSAPNVAR